MIRLWRRKSPGIWNVVGNDRIGLYKWRDGEWEVEISGPPLWPLVDVAGACRTSCGGVQFHFQSRGEALAVTDIYLRLFDVPPGNRHLRVISVLELRAYGPPLNAVEIEPDPWDAKCVAVWSNGEE